MKKLNIFLAAAMTLTLAACEEADGLGVMQTNQQEAIMQADGVKVAYGENLTGDAINLTSYENGTINVIKCTEAKDLPEGASVEYKMEVATNAEFSNAITLKVTDGTVKANDWEHVCRELVGKSPLPVDQWVRFAVFVKDAGSLVRVGGSDVFFASKKVTVTPYDLKLNIEGKYFLALQMDGKTTFKELGHSDRHQYDDPMFSLIIDVTKEQAAAGVKWMVVNEEYTKDAAKGKYFGLSEMGDPTDMNGHLEVDGGWGEINAQGAYKFEANMLNLDFNITFAFDTLYTPGPANGWDANGSSGKNMTLTSTNYIHFSGFVAIEDMFKITTKNGWSGPEWGCTVENNKDLMVKKLALGGKNMLVSKNGLYLVEVDLDPKNLDCKLTFIDKIGMIGGFNGWGADAELTPSADFKTWSGSVTVAEAGEWKFRMNGGWDINLGGSNDNLAQNGANLKFDAAGTYDVVLDLSKRPYSCTVTKK